jgi:transcriptional regulator with XRE-family HTH domain
MARRVVRVRDADLADALRAALANGAFVPADASRVIRALEGLSQDAFAARLGINAKVIKALESGRGNPRYDSLAKIADAAGLRVAFVKASGVVELLDPDVRALLISVGVGSRTARHYWQERFRRATCMNATHSRSMRSPSSCRGSHEHCS